MRSRYKLAVENSRLEIDPGCDRLGPTIDELVVEGSSGHGFSLRLDRLTRREDGDYDLLRLAFSHRVERRPGYCTTNEIHSRSIEGTAEDAAQQADIDTQWTGLGAEGGEVYRAVLPGDRVDEVIALMRADMALHPREVERPTKPDELRLIGLWGSSNDFHVAIRMTDDDGRAVAADWAGYEGSGDQGVWLPLDLASDVYNEMMWDEPIEALLEPAEVDADARNFFVERFRAAEARNDEYGIWYVRERLLAMAQDLGDQRIYADLVQAAAIPGKHSEARSRAAAAQALAVLSNWAPTIDGVTPLTPGEAAAHLVEACTSRD